MARRTLLGLALFACLMASGWAWREWTSIPDMDTEGDYIRVTVLSGRDALCSAPRDTVPDGILRIEAEGVRLPERECRVAQRQMVSEGTTQLALVCGPDPAGPDGHDALLSVVGAYAEWTGYVATGQDDFVETHATYLFCDEASGAGE